MTTTTLRAAGFSILLAGYASLLPAQGMRTITATRQAAGEDELHVKVEFGAGRFSVSPGDAGVLYAARLVYDEDRFEPVLHYADGSGVLTLGVSGLRGLKGENRDLKAQVAELKIAPDLPASLDLSFGATEADLELGGITLEAAEIKTGASQTRVRFSEPNRGQCDNLTFHVGAAEFTTQSLGNSRCAEMSFMGGATGLRLDFTGDWGDVRDVSADIAVGVGELILELPRDAGVEIEFSRFLATFDHAGLVKRGDSYVSTNYETAGTKLHLDIKAVIGSVEVHWR
jgi:hypothetical protein